jgi:hypothetical protein
MLKTKLFQATTIPIESSDKQISYIVSKEKDSPGTTSVTFSNVFLGSGVNKLSCIAVMGSSLSPSCSLISATLDGVSCIVKGNIGNSARWMSFICLNTNSATANIVLNFSHVPNYVYMDVYEVLGYSGTFDLLEYKDDSKKDSIGVNGTLSLQTSYSGEGLVIAAYHSGSVSSGANEVNWSGITKEKQYYFSSRDAVYSTAYDFLTSSSMSVSVQDSSVNRPQLSAIVIK